MTLMMLQVSYQLQYSKQELRKVIQSYPGKEVKKGLADLYKKVEKHLCEEENLVQVFSFCIVLYVNNVMGSFCARLCGMRCRKSSFDNTSISRI